MGKIGIWMVNGVKWRGGCDRAEDQKRWDISLDVVGRQVREKGLAVEYLSRVRLGNSAS